MCDNMLVNLTGIEGHCMPINLNIEHLIRFLKVRLSHGFVQGLTCISSFSLLQRESTPPGSDAEQGTIAENMDSPEVQLLCCKIVQVLGECWRRKAGMWRLAELTRGVEAECWILPHGSE